LLGIAILEPHRGGLKTGTVVRIDPCDTQFTASSIALCSGVRRFRDGTAREELTVALIRLVDRVARKASGTADDAAPGAVRIGIANATKVATNAALGKLYYSILEGGLKQAEIANLYADARLKNAQAAEIEERTAIERLERSVKLAMSLGSPVNVAVIANALESVLLGDGLSAEVEPSALLGRASGEPRDEVS
jgi:hypothetical protein